MKKSLSILIIFIIKNYCWARKNYFTISLSSIQQSYARQINEYCTYRPPLINRGRQNSRNTIRSVHSMDATFKRATNQPHPTNLRSKSSGSPMNYLVPGRQTSTSSPPAARAFSSFSSFFFFPPSPSVDRD